MGRAMTNQSSVTFGKRGVPMSERVNPYTGRVEPVGGKARYGAAGVDEGLRAFMLSVYSYVAMGLAMTGVVAFMTYSMTVTGDPSLAAVWDDGTPAQITQTEYLTELGAMLWLTPISYAVCWGPLLILIVFGGAFRNLSPSASMPIYFIVAGLIGVSFSGLALVYTNTSIAQMFFATASVFGVLSLYGYTTKSDLSGLGPLLWTGLIGVIGAIIFNFFMGSDILTLIISVVGLIVFVGFTAYDTQMIKQAYSERLGQEEAGKIAICAAVDLYLDFVNIFHFLLSLFGQEE